MASQQRPIVDSFQITAGSGRLRLLAWVQPMGDDLLVAVWGGDKPHIGAASLAISHPKPKTPEEIGATASTLAAPGHREEAITSPLSKALSARLGRTVVVVAGAHWDDIEPDEIREAMKGVDELIDQIVGHIKSIHP